MAATDERVEEEIRDIITSGEETLRGWSDQQVIAEAYRRVGTDAPGGAADRWNTVIAQIRSGSDNDGQTRT